MNPAAYAEINLAAVRHNLDQVRTLLPQAKIMAVVKANAYGHGLVRIARTLEQSHAKPDAFAVARIEEGVRLRLAGIQQRVVVLQGFSNVDELGLLQENALEPVIHQPEQVELLETSPDLSALTAWLKIDTGMNRLGFKPNQVDDVYRYLSALSGIHQPIHLMTHLASADETGNDFTRRQLSLFDKVVAEYPGPRSIANSAGLLGWPEARSEWVRPGIMLYGISPFSHQTGSDLGLRPVMSLYSKLIAVKAIEPGEKVGYSNTWVCEVPTTLGVVAIGYGDGYPRHAKSGTPVLVNGQRFPLIGRVSMDMITVDLGETSSAKPGDKVTLWGQGLAVEEIADCAGTIPYTLVCGVTQRVQILET